MKLTNMSDWLRELFPEDALTPLSDQSKAEVHEFTSGPAAQLYARFMAFEREHPPTDGASNQERWEAFTKAQPCL